MSDINSRTRYLKKAGLDHGKKKKNADKRQPVGIREQPKRNYLWRKRLFVHPVPATRARQYKERQGKCDHVQNPNPGSTALRKMMPRTDGMKAADRITGRFGKG